ncbi:MAG: hypothetical protein K2K50_00575, partial [Anaeroplasmataceae bacterium]|nr:hypothetical protein [Anaeroplasmataceae bacterium]
MKTKRLSINLITSFACKIISLLFSFVVRKLIIQYLGKEYLGLNSLFTDLLSFLNLADLGLGVVIQTCLYAHLVNSNEERIRGILNFTNKLFKSIALLVIVVGALLLPFINIFVKDSTFDINFLRIVFYIEVLGIA